MCGRYSLTHSAAEIAARFDVTAPVDFEARYNVAPTDVMPIIGGADGERKLVQMRWGLVPFWAENIKVGYRMINARSETVAKKPAYRAAFRRRRCLVPVDSFYEWVEKDGQKWPIRIQIGADPLGALAGLWERWRDDDDNILDTYTILTCQAHEVLVDIHDRMPVWAPPNHWDRWLFDDATAEETMATMIADWPADQVRFAPVSRQLNRAGNEGPHLVEVQDGQGLPRRD